MSTFLETLMSLFGTLVSMVLVLALILVAPAICALSIRYALPTSWRLVLFGLCILYGAFPLLLGAIGLHLAEQAGCQSMGLSYQCPGDPALGERVSALVFVGSWLPILTIPSSVLGILGFIIASAIKFFR